jgi:hypothetical protein
MPAAGEDLAEDLAVPALERLGLVVAELPADLAGDRPGEEPAAHPDTAVDPPAVDRRPEIEERPLPREDVRVDGVDQRPIEIEDQCAHAAQDTGEPGVSP